MCYKQEEGDFVCYGEEIIGELVPVSCRFLMFCGIFANLFDGQSVLIVRNSVQCNLNYRCFADSELHLQYT